MKKIRIQPVNAFVYGEDNLCLKEIAQLVPRSPHYLNLLRIGDIKEVKRQQKQAEKPTKENAK